MYGSKHNTHCYVVANYNTEYWVYVIQSIHYQEHMSRQEASDYTVGLAVAYALSLFFLIWNVQLLQ